MPNLTVHQTDISKGNQVEVFCPLEERQFEPVYVFAFGVYKIELQASRSVMSSLMIQLRSQGAKESKRKYSCGHGVTADLSVVKKIIEQNLSSSAMLEVKDDFTEILKYMNEVDLHEGSRRKEPLKSINSKLFQTAEVFQDQKRVDERKLSGSGSSKVTIKGKSIEDRRKALFSQQEKDRESSVVKHEATERVGADKQPQKINGSVAQKVKAYSDSNAQVLSNSLSHLRAKPSVIDTATHFNAELTSIEKKSQSKDSLPSRSSYMTGAAPIREGGVGESKTELTNVPNRGRKKDSAQRRSSNVAGERLVREDGVGADKDELASVPNKVHEKDSELSKSNDVVENDRVRKVVVGAGKCEFTGVDKKQQEESERLLSGRSALAEAKKDAEGPAPIKVVESKELAVSSSRRKLVRPSYENPYEKIDRDLQEHLKFLKDLKESNKKRIENFRAAYGDYILKEVQDALAALKK